MNTEDKNKAIKVLRQDAALLFAVSAYCNDNMDENMADMVLHVSNDIKVMADNIENDNEHTAAVIDGQLISENNNLKDLVRDMYNYTVDWGALEPRIRKCLGVDTRVVKSDD